MKSAFLRLLPNAGFLGSGWFMRLWEGQPFSFANFSIVIVATVRLSLLVFKCQHFACKIFSYIYRTDDAFKARN